MKPGFDLRQNRQRVLLAKLVSFVERQTADARLPLELIELLEL